MKVVCSLVVLFCLVIHSLAQQLPEILQSKELRKGIYLSFEEFLANSPSAANGFTLTSTSSDKKSEKGVADYRLVLFDSVKSSIRRRDIWGVCDGTDVFINELPYSGIHNFKRIHQLGRYCYFRGSIPSEQRRAVSPSLLGYAAIELTGDLGYILNINNGKVFALDVDIMRLILKKDSMLLMRYEQEEKKRSPETMLSYIDEYNEKYWMEASGDYVQPIEVIIYRTGKKEKPESFKALINDTLSYDMKPNSYYSFMNGAKAIKLCLQDSCFDIDLAVRKVNYIRCRWNKDGLPVYEKANREEGEYYSRIAKVLSEKEKAELQR